VDGNRSTLGSIEPEGLDRIAAVATLVEAISARGDLPEIFQIAKRSLTDLLPVDQVLVLLVDESQQILTISPALNRDTIIGEQGAMVPLAQTVLREVVEENRPVIRSDLGGHEDLPEGDTYFVPPDALSDMAVPISLGKEVLGVLHLASSFPNAFNRHHEFIAQEIALLLAMAIERARQQRLKEESERAHELWLSRYQQLFRFVHTPTAVVNLRERVIEEANPALAELLKYEAKDLEQLSLERAVEAESLPGLMQLLNTAKEAGRAVQGRVTLRNADGRYIEAAVRALPPAGAHVNRLLVLFNPLVPGGQLEKEAEERLLALEDVLRRALEVLKSKGSLEALRTVLLGLGTTLRARYGAVLMRQDGGQGELRLELAEIFGERVPEGVPANAWLAGLAEGPHDRVIQEGRSLFVPDVWHEEEFERWRPVAERLGYEGAVIVPLQGRSQTLGTLALYFPRGVQVHNLDVALISAAGNFVGLILENLELERTLGEKSRHIAAVNQITNSISSNLELEEVIRATFAETKKVIDYDEGCITLFGKRPDEVQLFTVVSDRIGKNLKKSAWRRFGKGDLGWLNVHPAKGSVYPKELQELGEQMQSKINVLLLSRSKYLGTFELASLDRQAFRPAHLEFLRQIASQIATAIENARLFEEANERVREFSVVAEVSKSVTSSLEVDEVLDHIVKAAAKAMNARVCTLQFVENYEPLSSTVVSADEWRGALPNGEYANAVRKIVEERRPVVVEDLAPMLSRKTRGAPKLRSFLGVPVISRGRPIAVLSVFWDTVRKPAERDLHLITTVANQAASAIDNARLYQQTRRTAEELSRANEELENFVFTVTHDLKSPIVSIQGFTSLVLEDYAEILDDEARQYLERVLKNVAQMERLIEDLLEFSRVGRLSRPYEKVSSKEIVDEVLSDYTYRIQEKGIEVHVADDLPEIVCDPDQINQVFTNLISNAVKYLGKRKNPRIEIGWRDAEDSVIFYVRDNGVGIPKEHQDKIFGLFHRVEARDEGEGTGIGLAIVRRIVETHGGRVWVESEPGQGATFYFSIPKREG